MQLSAKCLVIFQLTISILGVLRRQHIPLPTHPHTGAGVISGIGIGRSGMRGIGSSNCSKSNNSSSSSNGGRPELAQSYTNLGLTKDSGVEGTMKNLAGVPSQKKHVSGGSADLGVGYNRDTSQCIVWVRGVGANLEPL